MNPVSIGYPGLREPREKEIVLTRVIMFLLVFMPCTFTTKNPDVFSNSSNSGSSACKMKILILFTLIPARHLCRGALISHLVKESISHALLFKTKCI